MTFWPEVPFLPLALPFLPYLNDHLYKSRSKKSVYPMNSMRNWSRKTTSYMYSIYAHTFRDKGYL